MAFAGLTSGYVVSRSSLVADNSWVHIVLPQQFMWATVSIILGSISLVWGRALIKSGRLNQLPWALTMALILGILFAVFQFLGWGNLIQRGLFFTGPNSNTASSWIYVITFLHWLHVISGLIVLSVTLSRSVKGAYTKENHLGYEMASIYWHFLDGLWIYLYCFLLFIR